MLQETVIKPQSTWKLFDWKEVVKYRELLYTFAWRDIKVRYKQTMLGIAWVVLQPLVTMIIFTFLFGRLAKIPSGELPYSLFVLIGLTFWTLFSNSLTAAANSMVTNENIIKKIYFPKIVLPLSAVLTSSLDFVITFSVMALFAVSLGFLPSPTIIIILPLAFILTAVTSLGLGSFLAAVNVKYRDVRYVLPFFIQILLFVTPVIYSLNLIPAPNRYLLALNPMTLVVEMTRSTFSGESLLTQELIFISLLSSLIILFLGFWYFKKTERFFADIV